MILLKACFQHQPGHVHSRKISANPSFMDLFFGFVPEVENLTITPLHP